MYTEEPSYQEIYDFYKNLDRRYFIDDEFKEYAHYDQALPIGYEQTISQPSLVIEMTVELDLHKNCKVLEIGTGSGYQTAFLAKFAKEVYTIERIEELSKLAKLRLKELGFDNVKYKVGDGSEGWKEYAPYDRIIATAGAGKVPEELIDQLDRKGKMIIPVGEKGSQELVLLEKDEKGYLEREFLGAVQFVEFRGKYGWSH